MDQLEPAVFLRRRERVLERLGGGVLVLPAASVARRNGDVDHVYRQDSDFLYLTGFREPGSILVLNPNIEKRCTLFVRPRDKAAETWTGRRAGVEGAVRDFGADQAFPIDDFEKELAPLLVGAHTLYYPYGVDADQDTRMMQRLATLRHRPPAGRAVPEKVTDLGSLIHELRLFKQPEELAALRMAIELTGRGFARALAATRAGLHEYSLEAELLYEYRRGGGDGPGYEPIVASGVNATILHYRTGRDVLKEGDLVLIDSGCEWAGYTADVTRTWPVSGRFSVAQRTLYEVVLAAHSAAVSATRPGTTRESVHEVATRTLIDGLIRLGLLAESAEASWTEKTYRKYYMHGTSHWLGLDVHDSGSYAASGTPRPLAAGMVMTIEPGLYIAPDDTTAPEQYRGIGIRIEDDVLVTATGCEVLTARIPRTVEELMKALA